MANSCSGGHSGLQAPRPIRVVVADPQRLFADALAQALSAEAGIEVVDGFPTNGVDAIELAGTAGSHVALINYWLNGMDGAIAAALMRKYVPDCRIVIMGWLWGPDERLKAEQSGAAAVVGKDLSVREMAILITRIGAMPSRDPSATDEDADSGMGAAQRLATPVTLLTPREIEILQALSFGNPIGRTATALSISSRTLRNHLYNIGQKTGTRGAIEAIAWARGYGLITPRTRTQGAQFGHYPSTERIRPPDPSASPITVLIADAQPLFADSLALVLDREASDLTIIDQSPKTTAELLHAVDTYTPDIVVLDYWFSEESGAQLTSFVRERSSHSQVLLLSWVQGVQEIRQGLDAGAIGFLPRSIPVAQLVAAIRAAWRGEPLIYGHRLAQLVERIQGAAIEESDVARRFETLTPRESEVVKLLGRGLPPADIARLLSISTSTVRAHLHRILVKTGTQNQADVVALMHFTAQVDPDDPLTQQASFLGFSTDGIPKVVADPDADTPPDQPG